jgi:CRP/FNR family transcriptional regulator
LRRGEVLWRAGDVLTNLVVVQKGLVKLVRPTTRGRAICGLFGPAEAVDDLALVRGVACPTDAIAVSDSVTIVSLPRQEVLKAFEREPRLFLSLACSVEQKVETLFDKIDVLSAGSVEARLATLLLKLNDRFGDDFDDGTSEIPVALSRRDLAELVATSFETAIRIMSRWEREGLLETTRRGFTLRNVNRLGALSGSTAALAAE